MIQCYRLRITGRVQGVFYRQSAVAEARRLGISGFIQNEADASVYAEAAGSPEALAAFIAWCRRGPAQAHVEEVSAQAIEANAYDGFQIRR